MKLYGLIGFPLTHSFSKKYFTEKFQRENITDSNYENFPLLSLDEFPGLIHSHPELKGLNVTIPYKEQMLKFLDEIDEAAKEIGAVNTIKIADGKLKGFNTDYLGFMQSIIKILEPHHSHALILGTGGSSKAVGYGLKKMGIDFHYVSRNPEQLEELNYSELDKDAIRSHKLIINTTPLGMFPDVDQCPPISYEFLTASHLLYDLIYNPEETLFLKKGKEQMAKTENGLEMLQLQAERSWEIWNS